MQLLPYSGVFPAGLDSGLTLGSLLSLLEGFSASNSENAAVAPKHPECCPPAVSADRTSSA